MFLGALGRYSDFYDCDVWFDFSKMYLWVDTFCMVFDVQERMVHVSMNYVSR